MPRPQFIVCAESSAVDQEANRLSIFNVMDGITVFISDGNSHSTVRPEINPVTALNSLNFRVIAVWMRIDPDDSPKDEYDYEFTLNAPGEPEKQISAGTFQFSSPMYRLQLLVFRDKPWTETGMVKIVSKICKRSSDEKKRKWQNQSYQQEYWFPITVNHVQKEPVAAPDASLN